MNIQNILSGELDFYFRLNENNFTNKAAFYLTHSSILDLNPNLFNVSFTMKQIRLPKLKYHSIPHWKNGSISQLYNSMMDLLSMISMAWQFMSLLKNGAKKTLDFRRSSSYVINKPV